MEAFDWLYGNEKRRVEESREEAESCWHGRISQSYQHLRPHCQVNTPGLHISTLILNQEPGNMFSSILRRLQGGNLEVFKFGLYIGFPIGWMYYFGTNLEERFSVPDFWPTTAHSHKIPADKGEIDKELARMNEQRAKRLLEKQRIQKEFENIAATSNSTTE